MEIFPDGWCQCYAGCGRFHISHEFPEFRDPNWKPDHYKTTKNKPMVKQDQTPEPPREYKKYDLFPDWEAMPLIPRDHTFKNFDLETLDDLGWRWTDGIAGMGAGYFIPYFNNDKTKIPFAQVRHLKGERRFTFLPGAEMTVYGKWNLYPGEKIFVVEGPSDGAVLHAAMVPFVAVPSASCTAMLIKMAEYCLKKGITLVYSGDNDEAGESLRIALDEAEVAPYRLCQPPKHYKDWGEYMEGDGIEKVAERLNKEYMEPVDEPMVAMAKEVFKPESQVQTSML